MGRIGSKKYKRRGNNCNKLVLIKKKNENECDLSNRVLRSTYHDELFHKSNNDLHEKSHLIDTKRILRSRTLNVKPPNYCVAPRIRNNRRAVENKNSDTVPMDRWRNKSVSPISQIPSQSSEATIYLEQPFIQIDMKKTDTACKNKNSQINKKYKYIPIWEQIELDEIESENLHKENNNRRILRDHTMLQRLQNITKTNKKKPYHASEGTSTHKDIHIDCNNIGTKVFDSEKNKKKAEIRKKIKKSIINNRSDKKRKFGRNFIEGSHAKKSKQNFVDTNGSTAKDSPGGHSYEISTKLVENDITYPYHSEIACKSRELRNRVIVYYGKVPCESNLPKIIESSRSSDLDKNNNAGIKKKNHKNSANVPYNDHSVSTTGKNENIQEQNMNISNEKHLRNGSNVKGRPRKVRLVSIIEISQKNEEESLLNESTSINNSGRYFFRNRPNSIRKDIREHVKKNKIKQSHNFPYCKQKTFKNIPNELKSISDVQTEGQFAWSNLLNVSDNDFSPCRYEEKINSDMSFEKVSIEHLSESNDLRFKQLKEEIEEDKNDKYSFSESIASSKWSYIPNYAQKFNRIQPQDDIEDIELTQIFSNCEQTSHNKLENNTTIQTDNEIIAHVEDNKYSIDTNYNPDALEQQLIEDYNSSHNSTTNGNSSCEEFFGILPESIDLERYNVDISLPPANQSTSNFFQPRLSSTEKSINSRPKKIQKKDEGADKISISVGDYSLENSEPIECESSNIASSSVVEEKYSENLHESSDVVADALSEQTFSNMSFEEIKNIIIGNFNMPLIINRSITISSPISDFFDANDTFESALSPKMSEITHSFEKLQLIGEEPSDIHLNFRKTAMNRDSDLNYWKEKSNKIRKNVGRKTRKKRLTNKQYGNRARRKRSSFLGNRKMSSENVTFRIQRQLTKLETDLDILDNSGMMTSSPSESSLEELDNYQSDKSDFKILINKTILQMKMDRLVDSVKRPWRPDIEFHIRNPHFVKLKKSALPSLDQKIIIDCSYEDRLNENGIPEVFEDKYYQEIDITNKPYLLYDFDQEFGNVRFDWNLDTLEKSSENVPSPNFVQMITQQELTVRKDANDEKYSLKCYGCKQGAIQNLEIRSDQIEYVPE